MIKNFLHIVNHIICGACRTKMQYKEYAFYCPTCGKTYHIRNNTLHVESGTIDKVIDPLDKIKLLIKPFSKFYTFLIKIISPVYVDGFLKTFIRQHVQSGNLYLNLGSGNMRIHPDIINIDFIAYPNVDIVADITALPLENESCDGIFIIGVLEHVPDPYKVIAEIHRIVKKDGFVYAFFPFMQGYHASPHDYFRTTQQGIKVLFQSFENSEVRLAGGPTSGLLWILQEWLAMVLSLGISPLYYFWYIILMCITFPIKFLDMLLIHHPKAAHITSGFTIVAKK